MKIVVDANILFSALLSPTGKIAEIIITEKYPVTYYSSLYSLTELNKHGKKLLSLSSYSSDELEHAKRMLFKKIVLIDDNSIPENIRIESIRLLQDIDLNDVPYLSLALYLNTYLWSGDKKLNKGLKLKTLKKIVITTSQLSDLFI